MGLPAWFVGEPVLELNFAVKGVAKLSPSCCAPVSQSACWLPELQGVNVPLILVCGLWFVHFIFQF